METEKKNTNLWVRVAQIAGAFAFIISMLLIVNYAQYKRIDPVETVLINSLVERLNKNPQDDQLREEIRTLDLLSRKAYFTNQWQVRTGGYLLLLSIAVLVIAMQIIKSNSEKEISLSDREGAFLAQKNSRLWISISGAIIVVVALVFAFLTHNELSEEFANAALSNKTDSTLLDNEVADNNLITEDVYSVTNESVIEEVVETTLVSDTKTDEPPNANTDNQATENIQDEVGNDAKPI